MNAPHIATQPALSRRTFLRASGVALALPALEAMRPTFTRAAEPQAPRRMVAICNNLGFVPERFFPQGTSDDYVPSQYLNEIDDLRSRFTVFDGVSHPGVDGSHASDVSFLTAAPHPGGGGFKNSISLDQYVAAQLGPITRFPSLTLGVNPKPGQRSLSWTDSGALIPCLEKASDVYRQLFLKGSAQEVRARMRQLKLGQSIMDRVADQSKALASRLGAADRDRLDQFQSALRDVEKRLAENEAWAQKPKPEAPIPQPDDPVNRTEFMEKASLMYQMTRLAIQTDSTRAITLLLDSNYTPTVKLAESQVDITDGYHNLSHHGRNPEKLKQLEAIDLSHMRLFGDFLRNLQSTAEGDTDLLSQTSVLFGSNLGDANKHTTTNMPMLLAGGRFQHQSCLRFDRNNNYPLPNLFVSVLNQMGIPTDRFATSSGTMRGLNFV